MPQMDELERRITAALDRISQGLEALQGSALPAEAPPDRSDEVEALRIALEEERLANAQLEERVRAIKARQDAKLEQMDQELEAQRGAMTALDDDLQRLRAANERLRENNAALREANARGAAEPHLIDAAVQAELEGLRAARAADAAETRAVLGALEPLLSASAMAAGSSNAGAAAGPRNDEETA